MRNQREAEVPQYTVREGTTSASRARQPTPSSDDDDHECNVPDVLDEDAWDGSEEVDPFDLSRVRPDEDEESLRG